MGDHTQLTASDGHHLDAYVARPAGVPSGGLVVLQEAFGVNRHIRSVTDGFAADGFLAIAPALYDRKERGVELGYDAEDLKRGIAIARASDLTQTLKDISAALEYVRRETGKNAGVIGYCFGGSMAWFAATRLDPAAAVGYYGGLIPKYAAENPRCPVMLHFGSQDPHIPKQEVDTVQANHPEVRIFWYDADHGFNTEDRASYNPDAAKLARQRSLAFLREHI
jgi:carboxymethylenebutenolidase